MISNVDEISTSEKRIRDFSVSESFDLIHRIEMRDRDAFSECVTRYGPFVWHLAKSFTNSQDEAEKVTQEIFADVLHYREQSTPRRCDREIIVGIARVRMLRYIRRSESEGAASL